VRAAVTAPHPTIPAPLRLVTMDGDGSRNGEVVMTTGEVVMITGEAVMTIGEAVMTTALASMAAVTGTGGGPIAMTEATGRVVLAKGGTTGDQTAGATAIRPVRTSGGRAGEGDERPLNCGLCRLRGVRFGSGDGVEQL
jgi:hypothetical protein